MYHQVCHGVRTILGPLVLLIYINSIIEYVSLQLKLFVNDCLLYLVITIEEGLIHYTS